jgi:ABC-type transport system involved in multi-copper enzyme maturation permease subunit
MNALVKKEIRLLLPAWLVALLLAMVQAITRPYDFYVASLLFFGLTIMSLSTIGREASLNTFSSLLAQPAERIRIWQVKLSVLSAAFLSVFVVWLAAFGIAFVNSHVDISDRANSYNLFITICLIATATFTGGLWTTLLLRQLTGAFWLTLMVPATLSGFLGAFFANSESESLVRAVLTMGIGVYSIGGFLYARWLFFRAQDVGWSGGVIALPEWKFFSVRAGTAGDRRTRKPVFALFKKELQLQQGVLTGAIGVLVLHVGTTGLRIFHHFAKDSAGEALTAIVWMLWLVLPALLGSIAVAEERKLGVMENQLCLPVSRRTQFAVKFSLTLFLGILLGGVMPLLLELIAAALGSDNPMLIDTADREILPLVILGISAWFTLVSFFASSLTKNFLQAVGTALVTFIALLMLVPVGTSGWLTFFVQTSNPILLPLILMVPTLVVTLVWLAYLNFCNFREGWSLWRRQILGAVGAVLFIILGSSVIYHRAWEVLQPAEPAHGPAMLSLAQPAQLRCEDDDNLLVRLPDGRVWFDSLSLGIQADRPAVWLQFWRFFNPLPHSAGPQKFIGGTNWPPASGPTENPSEGKPVGWQAYVRQDGTLWATGRFHGYNHRAPAEVFQIGRATNWLAVAKNWDWLVALQQDGTLWQWPYDYHESVAAALRARPVRLGIHHDWRAITAGDRGIVSLAADGSLWFWPNPEAYEYMRIMIQLPKQPKFLGNVFDGADN